jgi:oxidase EvaA
VTIPALAAAEPPLLQSLRMLDGRSMNFASFGRWLAAQRAQKTMRVRRVPLDALDEWTLRGQPMRIAHASSRFFSVEGIRVQTDFGAVAEWDQPIIHQPEVGLLGLLMRRIDSIPHFLVNAKIEPGNPGGVQLSPTVQATTSNYSRVHGGRSTTYLDRFCEATPDRVVIDQMQIEHASRCLRKTNRNIVVEVDAAFIAEDDYCWLTLGEIVQLLSIPYLISMDLRSVLACLPLGCDALRPVAVECIAPFGRKLFRSLEALQGRHTNAEIRFWLGAIREHHHRELRQLSVAGLKHWTFNSEALEHVTGRYFSVIGVDVETDAREVNRWQQPMLFSPACGLNGFLTQEIDGVLHFLVRAWMYPGSAAVFDLGPTVSASHADDAPHPGDPPFLSLFRSAPETWVRHSSMQSEEGGRFFGCATRHVILEAPSGETISVPPTHRWLTLAQIKAFIATGDVNMEARSLICCLSLSADGDAEC